MRPRRQSPSRLSVPRDASGQWWLTTSREPIVSLVSGHCGHVTTPTNRTLRRNCSRAAGINGPGAGMYAGPRAVLWELPRQPATGPVSS